jgi:radical SAM protein with 4Fe4S-binding SPASM domain
LNLGSKKYHESVLENLRYAVQSPLRVIVSSVLTKENADEVLDIMRFSYDLGCDSYTLYPNVPAEKLNLDLIIPVSKIPQLADTLIAGYDSICDTRLIDMSIPCIQFTDVYSKWKNIMNIRLHTCGAGQYNLKITSEGKVSTCICQDAGEFIVGDLHNQDIDEIWNSPEILNFRALYKNIPDCSVCAYQSDCRGGCRNEAFVFGNNGILSNDLHCTAFNNQKKTSIL